MIKKFKNGNIRMKADMLYVLEDGSIHENFYHDEMFMADLSFNQIDGAMYLVDYNKQLVYGFSKYYVENVLKDLLIQAKNNRTIKLYPFSKKVSKSLIQDMENGY